MDVQGKRKAGACRLGGGKRRAVAVVEVEERDWTSLHGDIANHIAERLLAGDGGVKDYMAFRAVCSHWRASTDTPRDPTLADPRFRPRGWIPICENIGLRPADAGWIAYLHAATGKVRRGMLPEAVRGHRIVGFTDGLVVLLDTRTAAIRVVHPFTRVTVHFPTLAIFFHTVVRLHPSFSMDSFIWMNAFVCAAAGRPASIAVVITFPDMPLVITAQPGSKSWSMVNTDLNLSTTLPFNGRLYGMRQDNNQLVQVYPGTNNPASPAAIVIAQVPNGISDRPSNCVYYLVETMASMLLVVLHKNANNSATGFTLLAVDLRRGKLTPVTGLGGDKALFLGHDRCVSVSSKNLPSIVVGNTIHFAMPGSNPVTEYSFDDSLFKKPATQSQLHNGVRPIRWPVRPYTLADHLITYCHHREWTRGLMFHEFYYVPASYSKLREIIAAQDSKVVVPELIERNGELTVMEPVELPPKATPLLAIPLSYLNR
ncbi:uncharacterized protein LOC127765284 [Oryza glaberrima]|uniref:uncharacterized protein LOC127765284 n=1 Tax=Oryza glaberrima TaxID=4538 RepID=UPI00023E00CE|nr:uncharacterized protein LOC127765284 [Oryza glaberrima]